MSKCPKCGTTTDGKFCPNCGERIPKDTVQGESGTRRMQMRCKNCNGELKFDSDKSILSCPFCGSTEIIVESDEVKLRRMQAELESERLQAHERQQRRQYQLYQLELERAQKELEQKKAETEAKSERAEGCASALMMLVGAIVVIAMLIYFYFDDARQEANNAANNAENVSPTGYMYIVDDEPDAEA